MRRACAILLAGLALPAGAGPYDGLYRPDAAWGAGWDCVRVGADGGAFAVRDTQLFGVESVCDLSNPVAIRGISATLFDADCLAEGEPSRERIMLMRTETGIAVIRDGSVGLLRRCE